MKATQVNYSSDWRTYPSRIHLMVSTSKKTMQGINYLLAFVDSISALLLETKILLSSFPELVL